MQDSGEKKGILLKKMATRTGLFYVILFQRFTLAAQLQRLN